MTEKTERNKARQRRSGSQTWPCWQMYRQPSAGKASCPFPDGDFSAGTGSTFVIWAWNSPLDEVTRGQGRLFPAAGSRLYRPLTRVFWKPWGQGRRYCWERSGTADTGWTRSSAMLRESEARVNNLEAVGQDSVQKLIPNHWHFRMTCRRFEGEGKYSLSATKDWTGTSIAGLKQSKALLDKEIAMTRQLCVKGRCRKSNCYVCSVSRGAAVTDGWETE